MFTVATGASVHCGGSTFPFLVALANSSALRDFGDEARAGHGWVLPGEPSTQDRRERSWSLS